ncbi:MAG: DUF5908 family protein [Chitinophagales bacterium]
MPIEIKELNIKASIVNNKSKNSIDKEDFSKLKEKMKKELLKECVEEVLQIIELKNER